MSSDNQIPRRSFLAATAASATTLAMTAKSYSQIIGANDRIRIGFIGSGHIAQDHFQACNKIKEQDNLEFLGVCDCWNTRAEKGAELMKTKAFTDYHKILDIKEVDYVVVATPEHQHAQMTIEALDAGKAVYCEKPLTHTVEESLKVLKKQKETKKPIQVGVQGMADNSYATAAEALSKGLIGQLLHAQIDYCRWYQKDGPWRVPKSVTDNTTQPKDLDWNAWLGAAPKIGWNPHHYFEWRNYAAYSGGVATDLFVHRITRMIKACNLGYPRRVVGMGGIYQWDDGRDLPDNFEMICEYPEGMSIHVLGTMGNSAPIDHMIRGSRGTLYFTPEGWVAKNRAGKEIGSHKKTGAEDMALHHTNFHNHLRNGEALNCPADLGAYAVAAVCMANESWRTNQMMGWDETKNQIVPAHTLTQSHKPVKKEV